MQVLTEDGIVLRLEELDKENGMIVGSFKMQTEYTVRKEVRGYSLRVQTQAVYIRGCAFPQPEICQIVKL